MNVSILSYENAGAYIEYLVKVQAGDQGTWQFRKRYSLLREFHERLKRTISQLPHFPPKKVFGNKQPTFLQQRKAALEQYFAQLCSLSEVRQNSDFQAFIKPRDAVVLEKPQPQSPRGAATPESQIHRAQPNSQERAKRTEQQMNRIAEEVSNKFINLSTAPSPLDEEDVSRKRHEYAREIDHENVKLLWRVNLPTAAAADGNRELSEQARHWLEDKTTHLQEALNQAEVQNVSIVADFHV